MSSISLQEAQAQFTKLIHGLTPGDEITITENEKPMARLIRLAMPQPKPPRARPPVTGIPRAGRWQGKLIVPSDFKEPLEELREYVE